MTGRIPPTNIPIVDSRGFIATAWYRFLARSEKALPGQVTTGAGLEGGGDVANGVEISIADHGVGNQQLRNGLACSVIGRFPNSTGQVADIQAGANGRILIRTGDQLVFKDILLALVGVTIGDYVDDAAAAAGGIVVGGIYRNGSVLMVRVA